MLNTQQNLLFTVIMFETTFHLAVLFPSGNLVLSRQNFAHIKNVYITVFFFVFEHAVQVLNAVSFAVNHSFLVYLNFK